jgi:SHS2 domain-containing protein
MSAYRYLDDIAISDLAFEASGETQNELFEEAATALMEAMADLSGVRPRIRKRVALSAASLDLLLFDWLSELVYLKDAHAFLFSRFEVRLSGDPVMRLEASAWGEPIDPKRHTLRVDVKAVTYHLYEVAQKEGRWTARVVLDI